MATKKIAWNSGGGNITLTYTGQGNGTIDVSSDANSLATERNQTIAVKTTNGAVVKNLTVKQAACPVPVGTILNYTYSGQVKEVLLPAGKYKLQCWGAQGGTIGTYYIGGNGGYSEGEITLTKPTTLYVFVGGAGDKSGNGGWNGGGGGSGYSIHNEEYVKGSTNMACGGGATDIALVNSSMTYSSYRTNRSNASLLSRIIVAGGGSGGANTSRMETNISLQTVGTYTTSNLWAANTTPSYEFNGTNGDVIDGSVLITGNTYKCTISGAPNCILVVYTAVDGTYQVFDVANNVVTFTVQKDFKPGSYFTVRSAEGSPTSTLVTVKIEKQTSTTTTTPAGTTGHAGGGNTGGGYSIEYAGTENTAGKNGGFGYGANQTATNYRHCSACGGGGWYGGGGDEKSDTDTQTIRKTGGGSGFVNTAANAKYRPTGYTGLQLDSGITYAGNKSFEAVNGGKETGHSGDGYARITRLA